MAPNVARAANNKDMTAHNYWCNPKKGKMKSFLKLIPFIKPQWRLILLSLLLSLPMSAISSSPALLIQYLIDKVLVRRPDDVRVLLYCSGAVVGIYFLNMFVRFAFGYSARLANERIMRDIREQLFQHYVGLSSAFFTDSSVGGLMSRVMNDVFYVSQGIINLSATVRQLFTFFGTFGYALYLNPKLMAITLGIAPFLIWLSGRSGKLMKGYTTKMQEANGQVFSAMQEAFSGFRVIKAFALERFAFSRFKSRNDKYVENALKAARVEEIVAPSVELAAALAIAIVVYVGGRDVMQGRLTPGQLGAFFTCFALMINPIRTLNDLAMKFSQAGASADRIDEALAIQTAIVDRPGAVVFGEVTEGIEYRDVGFRYGDDLATVFEGMSFKVPKGRTVAIVGASGQGKSTLVNLLARFYDPTSGAVLIDGRDVRDYTLASLRSKISVVSQDVFLFNESVYDNIKSGNLDADVRRDKIIEAARAANAMDFIERLPQGWDTLVGERGNRLSGGERQRISIARAVLKNAPILILDEATSSLDNASEKAVQGALEHLMEGRTTLVIAHRLSTIQNADEIIVMEEGRIAERGTHRELLDRRGAYARFHSMAQ